MKSVKEKWDKTFSEKDYVYGTKPNLFFKETIEKYKLSGTLLLPAEGEGRNAVYAAKNGFMVTAIDISEAGKVKAEKLAKAENTFIDYIVSDFSTIKIPLATFDVAALIFAHFPNEIAYDCHRKIADAIKPNGYIIIEYFAKGHTKIREQNPNIGGPNTENRLMNLEEIKKHFFDFEILLCKTVTKTLSEGKLHNGKALVNHFIGKKKSV